MKRNQYANGRLDRYWINVMRRDFADYFTLLAECVNSFEIPGDPVSGSLLAPRG